MIKKRKRLIPKKNIVSPYEKNNAKAFNNLREQEFMLADKTRVNTYRKAIFRYIKPGDIVVDVGTGTGILSFFAAQKGAKKIYAIDHAGIISTAKRVAEFNQLDNIEFIKAHSTKFHIDSPADVIVHEQMGNFLFDEHMVENICDLRDRLLKKRGRIIPGEFELFLEPVKAADKHHIPMLREMKIHGVDFSCVKEKGTEKLYSFLWRSDPAAIDFFLCNPKPIYSLNLQTIHPVNLPKVFDYSGIVKRTGRLDGFLLYFKTIFDNNLMMNTGPFVKRATNWKYYLLRVPSRIYKKGETIQFHLDMPDITNPATWKWEL